MSALNLNEGLADLNRGSNSLNSISGHNQHGYNPANYQRHFHWVGSRQLSNPAINPGQKWHTRTQSQLSNKQLIQALNATQGHMSSYQTSYNSGSKCHTGTLAQLSNELLPIHPKLKGTISSLFIKTGNNYSLIVNSTELLYQLRYISLLRIRP